MVGLLPKVMRGSSGATTTLEKMRKKATVKGRTARTFSAFFVKPFRMDGLTPKFRGARLAMPKRALVEASPATPS